MQSVAPSPAGPGLCRADRQPGDAAAAGFTLLEVLLGLGLMAIAAALVLPALLRPAGPIVVRTAAYQVSALLRDARAAAISAGRPASAVVDSRGRWVEGGGRRLSLPAGVTVALAAARQPQIRFAPDGSASGGTVQLSTRKVHIAVVVDPDTGAVALAP